MTIVADTVLKVVVILSVITLLVAPILLVTGHLGKGVYRATKGRPGVRVGLGLLVLLFVTGTVFGMHWMAKSSGCVDYGGGTGFFDSPNCYTMHGAGD